MGGRRPQPSGHIGGCYGVFELRGGLLAGVVLRRVAVVILQQPAQPLAALNRSGGSADLRARREDPVLEPLMISLRGCDFLSLSCDLDVGGPDRGRRARLKFGFRPK